MKIDRTVLFEQVWHEPMKTLAASFGVSDVALRKKCLQAQIPVPERGYWAKLQAGKEVRQVSLPNRPPGMDRRVTIGESRYGWHAPKDEEYLGDIPEPPTFPDTIQDVEAEVAAAVGKVPFVRTFDVVHPEVGKLLKADELRREKQLASRWPIWDAPLFESAFEIRRLRILNSLFQAAVRFGGASDIRGREARDITITVHDVHVQLAIDTPANLKKDLSV